MINKRNLGSKKENDAAMYLKNLGIRIIEQNFNTRAGEIDIIGLDGEYICFVEVKYRKNRNCGLPEEAVNINKMKKICKTANYYMYINKIYNNYQMRFDVLAFQGDDIRYYPNAFMYIE